MADMHDNPTDDYYRQFFNLDKTDLETDEEEINPNPTEEDEEDVETPNIDEKEVPELWMKAVEYLGTDKDFLSDVESDEELFEKMDYVIRSQKVSELFKDPEMIELANLVEEGKITNVREYANFVYSEPEIITEFTDEEDAKKFLVDTYTKQGLKANMIEKLITGLEVDDSLMTEANEALENHNKTIETSKEARQAEYFKQQEVKQAEAVKALEKHIFEANNAISLTDWDANYKKEVAKTYSELMVDITTGRATENPVISKINKALMNPVEGSKLVAYLTKMISESGEVTVEPFLKQERSKAAITVNKTWKKQVEQKAPKSGGDGSKVRENVNDLLKNYF